MAVEGETSRRVRIAKRFKPNSLVKGLSGAAVLWALLPDDGSPAAKIHHAFRRETWREAGLAGQLVLCGQFLLTVPTAFALTAMCTARCGRRVRSETGKHALRQAAEQLWLACTAAVHPPWYYIFELYRDPSRSHAMEYLYRTETKRALYMFLREYLSSAETTDALRDKAAFVTRCRDHSLPAVPALAVVECAAIVRLDGQKDGLAHRSLFFKPIHGAGGRGASRWLYENGLYRGDRGAVLTEAQLIAHALRLAEAEPHVIREYVTNHSAIADLSAGALSTVRVVTCMDENGQPEVTHAVLRMASNREVIVDNFHAGGVAASIDIATGRLGRATNIGLTDDTRWLECHPVTGAPIYGRVLPLWAEVVTLARRAHLAFADQVAVGWDIALLENGPHLVEGNKSPDLDIIQRCYRAPVGNSRLGQLLAFHVERALKKKYAAAEHGGKARLAAVQSSGQRRGAPSEERPMSSGFGSVADVVEIERAQCATPTVRTLAAETLETGGILFLREGFQLTERERELVADASVTLPTRKERESRNGRPTVLFDPDRGKILHARMRNPQRRELEAMMARFGEWSEALVRELFPAYAPALVRDRVTYRPCERAKLQGLHVDASYGRPTEGRAMLRVFCNVNPGDRPRVWQVGEAFEPFVRRFLPGAKPKHTSTAERLLARLGVTHGLRTNYDLLMEALRAQAKEDEDYQGSAPRRVVEFPAGSAWIAITDLVLHAAVSGQHSLDQTFFLPPAAMTHPERSSLKILEHLSARSLA